MTQGKAIATVQGRKIAETDEYEVVEGNTYVRLSIPAHSATVTDNSAVPTFVSISSIQGRKVLSQLLTVLAE